MLPASPYEKGRHPLRNSAKDIRLLIELLYNTPIWICVQVRASGILWTMAKTTKNVRIYADSWKRFKIMAAKKGISLIELLELLSLRK